MKNLDGLSVYEAENKIREYLNPLFVRKPIVQKLKSNTPSQEEMKAYLDAKVAYEKELEEYSFKNNFYSQESDRLWSLIEDKIKEKLQQNSIK